MRDAPPWIKSGAGSSKGGETAPPLSVSMDQMDTFCLIGSKIIQQ